MPKVKLKFPKGFLWGAASSAYQTEGGNTNSDWWVWEHGVRRTDALIKQGKKPEEFFSGEGSDFYNRYDEDFNLAQQLGHSAIRIGVEWSRIEPQEGQFDEKVMDHYEKMLQSAKFHGLTVFLTLHHYSNPVWFAKKGAFVKKENIFYFVRFSETVVKRFSQYVDFWVTINEPELYASQSYGIGKFPPQFKRPFTVFKVLNNLIKAHNEISNFIKENFPKPVSLAFNLTDLQSTGFWGNFTTGLLRHFGNGYVMLRAINHIDYIGVNYYFHHHVGLFGFRKNSYSDHQKTDRGWGIHPEGIERVLLALKVFNKPLYILENGLADAKDTKRQKFINDHLYYVHKAIQQGVDVRGYLYWSLTDNFEWEEGYAPRFGLIEIDREDLLRRRIRASAWAYAETCKNNYIDYDV
jgi:beta-glucosidase